MNKTIITNNEERGNDLPVNAMSEKEFKNKVLNEQTEGQKENKTASKKATAKKNTIEFKPVAKIEAGVDAGNGYFKYYYFNYMVSDKKGMPLMKKGEFESVLDIDDSNSTDDISIGDTLFINGHACRVHSGVRIGERREAFTKQNEYTRANFYYSLLRMYLQGYKDSGTIINDFYIALGTTTDIYDNERERENYRQYMLGNIDYKMYGDEPLNGKITFKYFNEKRGEYSEATINIKKLIIEAEGTSALHNLDIKETGFSFEEKTVVLDLGSQTSHVIPYIKNRADYDISPNRKGGYIQLVKRLMMPLSRAINDQISYQQAEVEFKRREGSPFEDIIKETIYQFIEDVVEKDLEKANTQFGRDQIVVTGGTSIAIKEELTTYFEEKHGAKLMFVKNGFHANAYGLLVKLSRQIKTEKAKASLNK